MKFQEGTGSWGEAVKIYRQPEVIRMIFLGFSAGLPLLLVFSTLTAWLTDLDISRTSIGFFGWVGITYSIKFLGTDRRSITNTMAHFKNWTA